MRKLLVAIVLMMGFGLTAFSQSGGSLSTDTSCIKIGFPNTLKLNWQCDSLNYKRLLNHPAIAETGPDSKSTGKRIFLGRPATLAIKAPHNHNEMPCLDPKGNYQMPVYRTDSTVNYTLLIKKY